MRKNITDKLQMSLENERNTVKKKSINSIEDRFINADNVFNKNPKLLEEKINVVRDTFTFPKQDYDLINFFVTKMLDNKIKVNKSEVLRAGLIMLSRLNDTELISTINFVEKVKTGRPKNSKLL